MDNEKEYIIAVDVQLMSYRHHNGYRAGVRAPHAIYIFPFGIRSVVRY
jgi:hypothetical protein